jgi:hypothetical protein
MAASDDEIRVAATPYGIAVTIALHDLSFLAACLRTDIRRGQFDNVGEHLKALHDGVRGLRTELDLRNDSAVGQATDVDPGRYFQRAAVGNRQRARPGPAHPAPARRQGHSAGAKIDATEVDETAALIDFVAVCRTYASELAINEVTLRTYSDLQHYVEHPPRRWCNRCAAATPRRAPTGRCRSRRRSASARSVRPRLCVADEPGGRKCRDRRAQTIARRIKPKASSNYNFWLTQSLRERTVLPRTNQSVLLKYEPDH